MKPLTELPKMIAEWLETDEGKATMKKLYDDAMEAADYDQAHGHDWKEISPSKPPEDL